MNDLVKNYLDKDGYVKVYPSKRKYKNAVLLYLSSKFEKGKIYSEKEVCEIIDSNCLFKDSAWIRTELVGMKFLNRKKDCSEYWKEDIEPTLEELLLK